MSQTCALDKCIRTSRGQCDCCQQQLCLQHLNEHNVSLINQLNPLTDEINILSDRLNNYDIKTITGHSRRQLEQWRNKFHQQIDRLFEQKCQELDAIMNEKVQKQREKTNQLQCKLVERIREQETTRQQIDSLTSTMHDLKEQMNELEKTYFKVYTNRLANDDALISIETITEHELDLSNLPPPCRSIQRVAGSNVWICANDDYLLMHQKPNLCLIDHNMNVVKEVLWNYENIYDMCWCSTLDRFIVNNGTCIFLVDDNKMTIEKVDTIEELEWSSCTTSENYLFLSTNIGGSIVRKYDLLPSIKLVFEWTLHDTCEKDEAVYDLKYSNETLALLIKNQPKKSLRMELRSAETLDRIWLLVFDTVCEQNIFFRCCSLICNQWLIADHEAQRLLHVTKDGKLKVVTPYETVPWLPTIFRNMLAVSRKCGIDFYNIQNSIKQFCMSYIYFDNKG